MAAAKQRKIPVSMHCAGCSRPSFSDVQYHKLKMAIEPTNPSSVNQRQLRREASQTTAASRVST